MNNEIIYVASASDHTLIMFVPEMNLSKTWTKRGQRYPFQREQLIQAYYNASVERLFRDGLLVTDDKEFLKAVGLMDEDEHCEVVNLTEDLLKRMIKLMPVADLKIQAAKLSKPQLNELGEYAISHYSALDLGRVDVLSKLTGKNILKAIENYKAAQEG